MITHNITVVTPEYRGKATDSKRFKGIHGSEEHRKFIYHRAVSINPYKQWDDVLYKGEIGHITEIKNYDEVTWQGLKPCYIELWLYTTNDWAYVHHSDIRKAK